MTGQERTMDERLEMIARMFPTEADKAGFRYVNANRVAGREMSSWTFADFKDGYETGRAAALADHEAEVRALQESAKAAADRLESLRVTGDVGSGYSMSPRIYSGCGCSVLSRGVSHRTDCIVPRVRAALSGGTLRSSGEEEANGD